MRCALTQRPLAQGTAKNGKQHSVPQSATGAEHTHSRGSELQRACYLVQFFPEYMKMLKSSNFVTRKQSVKVWKHTYTHTRARAHAYCHSIRTAFAAQVPSCCGHQLLIWMHGFCKPLQCLPDTPPARMLQNMPNPAVLCAVPHAVAG